jgi:hypothetical protein
MPDNPKKDTKQTEEEIKAAAERLKKFGKRSAGDAGKILDLGKPPKEPKKP